MMINYWLCFWFFVVRVKRGDLGLGRWRSANQTASSDYTLYVSIDDLWYGIKKWYTECNWEPPITLTQRYRPKHIRRLAGETTTVAPTPGRTSLSDGRRLNDMNTHKAAEAKQKNKNIIWMNEHIQYVVWDRPKRPPWWVGGRRW